MTSPWLPYHRPRRPCRLRLFCFPYAGGGASVFRAWADGVPADVEVCAVQLPGRENRLAETPFTRIDSLVEALASGLRPYLDRPFVFFGHSMGARLGFELVRRLRREGGPHALHLLVSAARAPHLVRPEAPIHDLEESEFVNGLRRLGSIPEPVLQDAELRGLFLPILRADFSIVENYRYVAGEPLDFPIACFGAVDDKSVTREHLEAWAEHTTHPLSLRMFAGDHLYLQAQKGLLLQAVSAVLGPIAGRLEKGAAP